MPRLLSIAQASRICGTGGALANAPLMQDKAYWEVKVQTEGVWGLGLAGRQHHPPPRWTRMRE